MLTYTVCSMAPLRCHAQVHLWLVFLLYPLQQQKPLANFGSFYGLGWGLEFPYSFSHFFLPRSSISLQPYLQDIAGPSISSADCYWLVSLFTIYTLIGQC